MLKLTNANRNKILARSLFVDGNKSYIQIGEILEVSQKTISNYQSKDKSEGFDWLSLRALKTIQSTQEKNENMYTLFTSYMMDSLKEIRENEELAPAAKAQMIVSLGDSFSKMGKVARQEDPEVYKLGIIKVTIEKILFSLKSSLDKENLKKVIDVIYDIQEDIANAII